MKKYTIHEDYYYTSNGCDCCEPDKWENYVVKDDSGEVLGVDDGVFGFQELYFNSKDEAFEYILGLNSIQVEYTYEGED